MSWTTVIWSMVSAACLTMALPHLIIGISQRGKRVHLMFALIGVAVAWMAVAEWLIMHAATTQASGRALQMAHVPTFVVVFAIIGFVQLYFGTGRLWLAILACGARAASLILNFFMPPNLNFREITSLRSYSFLGETVTMPVGPPNPWILLGYLSSLLFLAFVIDASLTLWRRGSSDSRRRALLVGGSIVIFIIAAQGAAAMVNAGMVNLPYCLSIAFMVIVVAMGFELSFDLIRAVQLSRALHESEERMNLAAECAQLSMWEWDVARDEIWMTAQGREMLGFGLDARLNFASLSQQVHPEDREARDVAIRHALRTGGSYEMEYRRLLEDGTIRWLAARGRCSNTDSGAPTKLLGVSIDITERKAADAEAQQQREEFSHLSRVALVGEMATSLAHELNQPLTAIVANASAAQRFIARGEIDPDQFRELLADINADGLRAGEVIRGIKGMVRKVGSERRELKMNDIIAEVLRLVRADALAHNCTLVTELDSALPPLLGDAVQLQQVLLNLIINAFDAMRKSECDPCRVEIQSRCNDGTMIEVSVRDFGPGLPDEGTSRVFERFFSTKRDGMGMGLAIARSIIEAHAGTLGAENAEGGGARFWFRIPAQLVTPEEVAA